MKRGSGRHPEVIREALAVPPTPPLLLHFAPLCGAFSSQSFVEHGVEDEVVCGVERLDLHHVLHHALQTQFVFGEILYAGKEVERMHLFLLRE